MPEKHTESYVGYYKIIGEGKPKDLKVRTGTDLYFEDDWFMIEHPDFYKEVYLGILKNERKNYIKVPTRKVFAKYQQYVNIGTDRQQREYRLANLDLDEWGQIAFGWKSISEWKRKEGLSAQDRLNEEVAAQLKRIRELALR